MTPQSCLAALMGVGAMLAPLSVSAQTAFASFAAASEPVLNDPHDLAFGPDGKLYIADKFGHRIVVMDPETLEVLSTFGDGQLPGVHDISFGPDGRAYTAVTGASAVVVFDLRGAAPEPVGIVEGMHNTEGALAHSNGRLYVMASGTGQLVMLSQDAPAKVVSGHPGAHDVEEAPDGSIWVADNRGRRLVRYSQELEKLQEISGPAYGFVGPRYLDIDDFGRLVVADQDAHRILLIDPETGALEGVLGDGLPGMGPMKFDDPEGVAVRGSDYYFSDSDNNRIVKYVVVMN